MAEGFYKNKNIKYRPGKILAAIKKDTNLNNIKILVENLGGKIEYFDKDNIEISVPTRDTLIVAEKLSNIKDFRFVSPDIF